MGWVNKIDRSYIDFVLCGPQTMVPRVVTRRLCRVADRKAWGGLGVLIRRGRRSAPAGIVRRAPQLVLGVFPGESAVVALGPFGGAAIDERDGGALAVALGQAG